MVAEHGLLVKVETWKYIEECISNRITLTGVRGARMTTASQILRLMVMVMVMVARLAALAMCFLSNI